MNLTQTAFSILSSMWPLIVAALIVLILTLGVAFFNSRIKAVFKREFKAYFNSPVAYIIMVIFISAVMGFTFFASNFLQSDDASLRVFFGWHPFIYMVLVPAVGMRLWSEEHRLGTMELLMTMPISPWHAIIGKFLAASLVWFIALVLTAPIVWTVSFLGNPDIGPIISAYISSFLYAISCLAVTSAVSAFTRSQVICFVISVAICLALTLFGMQWVIDPVLKAVPPDSSLELIVRVISYCCFLSHYHEMSKGLLVLRDILYFLSVVSFCLMVTHYALQSRRA